MSQKTIIHTETDKTILLKVARQLGQVEVIFDCGARDALDGIELAESLGAKELHTFECNPPSVELCRKNLLDHLTTSVASHVCHSALSDRIGEIEFHPIDTERTRTPHKDGNPGASSLFKASTKYTRETYVQSTIRVPTTTIDDYCKTHRPPDLLWLDVQGAELMVINGARLTLQRVKVIHLEVSFREMYSKQPLFGDIDSALGKQFKLIHLDVGRWPRVPLIYRLLRWGPWLGNAIYVNRLYFSNLLDLDHTKPI